MGFIFFNFAICLNAILASIFLLIKNKGQVTSRFFAEIMISMCLMVVVGICRDYFESIYKYMLGLECLAIFVLSAELYNYTLANLGVYQFTKRKLVVQGTPVLLSILFYIIYMLLPGLLRDSIYTYIMQVAASGPEPYYVVLFAFPVIYGIAGCRIIIKFKKSNHKLSDLELKHTLWLERFNYCFIFIFSLAIISEALTTYAPFCKYLYILNLLIYSFFVHQLIKHPKIIFDPLRSKTDPCNDLLNADLIAKKEGKLTCVIEFIERKESYLDQELSLNKLSDMLNMSHIELSQLLNQELKISFPILINSYRIKYACKKLVDPGFKNHTIEAIGLESGFKSRAAFYEAFRSITGQTPNQFRNGR